MVDRQAISHVKARRDLHRRISSQRVFCIDSNPYFRDFVCWFLSDVGCEVAAAATGGEALSLIRQKPSGYDLLVVADWLPDMDGVELLQTLRSIHYAGRIAVTAPQLSPEQRSTYESLGASSILITPVGYCELMRILEPVIATSCASWDQRDDSAYGQALPSFAR
jgi:DNA-binding response OmpR family regulator